MKSSFNWWSLNDIILHRKNFRLFFYGSVQTESPQPAAFCWKVEFQHKYHRNFLWIFVACWLQLVCETTHQLFQPSRHGLGTTRLGVKSAMDETILVTLARVAERAERYDEMADFMKQRVSWTKGKWLTTFDVPVGWKPSNTSQQVQHLRQ